MHRLKNIILFGLISSQAFTIVACSDKSNEAANKESSKDDHIWKHQTDTLQSAKDSVKKMQESIKQQQSLDENN